jgi:hypothetical protein
VSKATQYQTLLVSCSKPNAKYGEAIFYFPCKDKNESREQCNLYSFTPDANFTD